MAESLLTQITDQYFASNLTIDELRALARSDQADPLKEFGEVCRADIASILAGV
jgi:hypothetical protein